MVYWRKKIGTAKVKDKKKVATIEWWKKMERKTERKRNWFDRQAKREAISSLNNEVNSNVILPADANSH